MTGGVRVSGSGTAATEVDGTLVRPYMVAGWQPSAAAGAVRTAGPTGAEPTCRECRCHATAGRGALRGAA